MPTELVNGFGKVYLTIEYDPANQWVYNNWVGYQTYVGIIRGADECLYPLLENQCSYLLNDNRQVLGPWDHAVQWLVTDWAPRAVAQGLTHFAQVVSPESFAAQSADAMYKGISDRFQMRMFDNIVIAQTWLYEEQKLAAKRRLNG
ncbi:hypothetical protein [Hymenobacter crusticola]|uniref:STAS/SEC14 domain-containing protein n=1 Tax=Hymenobacter crusticola TaxID=1770526 RepID=A0A243W9X1_9BACT|nr:hypothetical protein [Hymenobacter crusticola]OUJ72353.1 hypothetical protein BXP70_19060 [Hymenobacter crusticola]